MVVVAWVVVGATVVVVEVGGAVVGGATDVAGESSAALLHAATTNPRAMANVKRLIAILPELPLADKLPSQRHGCYRESPR